MAIWQQNIEKSLWLKLKYQLIHLGLKILILRENLSSRSLNPYNLRVLNATRCFCQVATICVRPCPCVFVTVRINCLCLQNDFCVLSLVQHDCLLKMFIVLYYARIQSSFYGIKFKRQFHILNVGTLIVVCTI